MAPSSPSFPPLTGARLRPGRIALAAGAMEAFAFAVMAFLPQAFTELRQWVAYGILVGGVGAAAVLLAVRLTARRTRWRIRALPLAVYGMAVLPLLWLMIEGLDSRWLGDFYGAPGSALSALLSAGAIGLGGAWLYPRVAERAGANRFLRSVLVLAADRVAGGAPSRPETIEVEGFHPALALGFAAFEALFVFLQVLADGWVVRPALERGGFGLAFGVGALAWFAIGAGSAALAAGALRRASPEKRLVRFRRAG